MAAPQRTGRSADLRPPSRPDPLLPGGATASLTGFTYIADTLADQLATSPVSLLSPVGGGLLLTGYALVAAIAAVLVPMRRDVH
ncbi:hypothetical protein [Streptomyces sp. NPDC052042]|uniref:hypothetical protein n=1 Tax=Streptomyces sp. NPDC052042 TaxID=3365683 RepID=UPI0037D2E4E2